MPLLMPLRPRGVGGAVSERHGGTEAGKRPAEVHHQEVVVTALVFGRRRILGSPQSSWRPTGAVAQTHVQIAARTGSQP